MITAVGYHEVLGFHCEVVACDLVKRGLRDFDFGRLAFYQNKNATIGIENHHIVPFGKPIDFEQFFDVDERFGVIFLLQKILHHVLTYPFLGREDDELAPDFIKDAHFPVGFPKAKIIRIELEWLHAAKKQNLNRIVPSIGLCEEMFRIVNNSLP